MRCRHVDFNEVEMFKDGGEAVWIPGDPPGVREGERLFVFCSDVGFSVIARRYEDGQVFGDILDGTRIDITEEWYALLCKAEASDLEVKVTKGPVLDAQNGVVKYDDICLA